MTRETRHLVLHRRDHAAQFFQGARPARYFDATPKPIDDQAVNLGPTPIERQFCFASSPRKPNRWPCRFTFLRAQTPDEIATKASRRIRCGALPS